MRILLFQLSMTPTPDYSQIATALRDRGHAVWLGAPNENGDRAWHEGDGVVRVIPGPKRLHGGLTRLSWLMPIAKRIAFLGFLLRVRKFVRRSRPDIVQVNRASVFLFWLLPLLMPRQVSFVLDFRQVGQRGSNGLISKLRGWLAIRGSRFCSSFVYQHACFLHEEGAKRILGKDWERRGSVVPLGVGDAFLKTSFDPQASRIGDGIVRFLYIGGLSTVRRLDRILFAAMEVLSQSDRFAVVLMGTDKSEGFYHTLIDDLSLTSFVTIRPPVEYAKVPEAASDYDVALAYVPEYPTHWQYHPTLKVLEYRALGMPIIATDNLPNREVVEHGANGLIVSDSGESLASAMLRFITDRRFLQGCRNSAQKMRRGKSWAEVAEMYERAVYAPLQFKQPFADKIP